MDNRCNQNKYFTLHSSPRWTVTTTLPSDFGLQIVSINLLSEDDCYCITKKYRPEPGLEPRASCLAHKHSTTELSKTTQFCYLNLGFFLITLSIGSYMRGVCVWDALLRQSRVAGVRARHMYVGCYMRSLRCDTSR